MNDDDKDIYLYKAKQNVKRMLDVRKIQGTDVDLDNDTDFPKFIWAMKRGSEWAVIFVQDINKAVVSAVFEFCHPSEGDRESRKSMMGPVRNCIIIYQTKCTPTAGKQMTAYEHAALEWFTLEEVLVCPINSNIVPKYEILNKEDAQIIKDAFGGEEKLAKILTTDAIQKYYNCPVGTIYKITGSFGSLQPFTVYRVVTPPIT